MSGSKELWKIKLENSGNEKLRNTEKVKMQSNWKSEIVYIAKPTFARWTKVIKPYFKNFLLKSTETNEGKYFMELSALPCFFNGDWLPSTGVVLKVTLLFYANIWS